MTGTAGTIATFYSYKGGVGRTFALANVAVTLSRWGYRTLCIDWDLDAPGLPFYIGRWAPALEGGLVDLATEIAAGGRTPDPKRFIVTVDAPATEGRLHFLPAGAGDDAYVRRAQEIDWSGLYRQHDFGATLESWRDRWKEDYDVVLVDSRTGITDIGGICTAQLPDILVAMFTASEQSVTGVRDVIKRAEVARDRLPYDRFRLLTLPVPTRFDSREEYRRAEYWRARFAQTFEPHIGNWVISGVDVPKLLELLTIPYISYWSFGEDLPAVEESDPTPERIGYALQTLAATIAHRLDKSDLLTANRDSFVRSASAAPDASAVAAQTPHPPRTGVPLTNVPSAGSPPVPGHGARDASTDASTPPGGAATGVGQSRADGPRRHDGAEREQVRGRGVGIPSDQGTAGTQEGKAGTQGKVGTRPAAWRKRGTAALAAALLAAIILLITALSPVWWSISGSASGTCDSPYLVARGTECIGLTKEKGSFTTAAGGGDPGDRQVSEIWGRIVDENTLAESKGLPYVTVIVAAQLSSIERPSQRNSAALTGALLAMQAWNDDSARRPFLVRVWAVNIGSASRYAGEAADAIRAVADDPTVVAVTGLGQTRSTSADTIRKIGRLQDGSPGFPMVASTQSGDKLAGLPYYFRIAAPNKRQSDVGASWVFDEAEWAGVQPFIVYAKDSAYSEGLAQDYRAEVERLGAFRPDRFISFRQEGPNTGRVLDTGEAEIIEDRMCGDSPTADGGVPVADAPRLVIYTGGVADLSIMLDELNDTSCAANFTVLGGDALTGVAYPPFPEDISVQLAADNAPDVVYTAFGPESNDPARRLEDFRLVRGWDEFLRAYTRLNDSFPRELRQPAGPNSEMQAEYDAVNLVAEAVERAYRCNTDPPRDQDYCRREAEISGAVGGPSPADQEGNLPDRSQVYAALRLTTGDQIFAGVTGFVDFGSPPDPTGVAGADPRDKLVVLHEMRAGKAEGTLDISYICSAAARHPEPSAC